MWGATPQRLAQFVLHLLFQSTPPVWGATQLCAKYTEQSAISIHAPRVGGDSEIDVILMDQIISIHAPRVGGDTIEGFDGMTADISIHAPRVGGDWKI